MSQFRGKRNWLFCLSLAEFFRKDAIWVLTLQTKKAARKNVLPFFDIVKFQILLSDEFLATLNVYFTTYQIVGLDAIDSVNSLVF